MIQHSVRRKNFCSRIDGNDKLETVYGRDPSVDYEALQSYSRVGTKLNVTVDGLVLKGSQIVIPASLQRQVLELAHEGHQGGEQTQISSQRECVVS